MAATPKSRLGRGLGGIIANAVKPAPAKQTPASDTAAAAAPNAPAAAPNVAPNATAPAAPVAPAATGFQEIAVSHIEPSPYQARREITAEQLNELAESIRAEGLLQPIVVRRHKDKFQLIAGERRWRAYLILKIKTIPARVVDASNASAAALGLIENLQREGLNPIDEAYGYASLIRDFDLTQEAAASRVGKSRAGVANTLRLLSLDAEIQGYLAKGLVSVGHAKVLLGIGEQPQRALIARRIIEEGLSVRVTEKIVQTRNDPAAAAAPATSAKGRAVPAAEFAVVSSIQKKLTSHLGARVQVKHTPKRGRIIIEYAGNADLQRILEKLGIEA